MKTHYDVLELGKNCSAAEIKDSYIKLSKKYHPDVNKSTDAHKRFIQVNEAYSVLGKSDSRLKYDETLAFGPETITQNFKSSRVRTEYMTGYEYMHKMSMKKNAGKTYTNYFSSSRLSTIFCCCILMIIGAGIQLKYAWYDKTRRDLMSHRTSMLLSQAKNRAQTVGRKQSIIDFANGSFTGVSMKDVEDEVERKKLQKQNSLD